LYDTNIAAIFDLNPALLIITSTPINMWRFLIYQIVGISVLNKNITTFSVFGAAVFEL